VIFWLDAHFSPRLAIWIEKQFGKKCIPLRDKNLHFAKDEEIFAAARKEKVVMISKDRDFQDMVLAKGSPPQVLWITCGNTSNVIMQEILAKALPEAIVMLEAGEPLVEITN
jgi:predicted nuclease of predicted toxin-antitoxin system